MKPETQLLINDLEARDFSRRVLKKRSIGIIEDDRTTNNMIKKIITKCPYGEQFDFYSWYNKETALKELFNKNIDLLIIDINLPYPVGNKIGQLVRDFYMYEIPIIYISSDHTLMTELHWKMPKHCIFLPKPLDKNAVIKAIESLEFLL